MSTFGDYFRVTTYGESHCRSVGCIVDGVPPGMELTEADIQPQMTRRRPGQSALTTPRNEKDRVEIQSGTEFGVTLGTPIGLIVRNEDQRPKDYGNKTMDLYPRPSHADFTYLEKYGVKASSGGGRSSARETIGMSVFGSGRAGRPEGQWLMFVLQDEWQQVQLQKNICRWRMEWRLWPLYHRWDRSIFSLPRWNIPHLRQTPSFCLLFPRSQGNKSTLLCQCGVPTLPPPHG